VATECALLYTSGTTGRPKGCILPNEYFLWAGHWYAGLGALCEIRPGAERMITPLPLTHMNAMACSTMCMLLTGGCLVVVDRFHPRSWWDSVRESRATVMHYLGVMPAMLLAAPPSPSDREHALRFGFGAGVQPRHHAAFEQRFGVALIEAWAMTETGAGAAIIANREPRRIGTACFGRPDRRVEYRLVDQDGRDAVRGEPGELLVRAAGARPRFGFFAGYLKDEPATTEAWREGWFHTGDLVREDDDGQLHFVDRRRNLIRRSGENVSALEVEGVLLQHPAVASAGVTAVPDELRGDEVMACVVLRSTSAGTDLEALARTLVDFCLDRLAYYKAPGYVSFCATLPLTLTEKIQRARLTELGRRLLDEGAYVDTRGMKRRRA
jgi:acyl-CoA synthetase (AMP-forming)/AMP-acid ligase II